MNLNKTTYSATAFVFSIYVCFNRQDFYKTARFVIKYHLIIMTIQTRPFSVVIPGVFSCSSVFVKRRGLQTSVMTHYRHLGDKMYFHLHCSYLKHVRESNRVYCHFSYVHIETLVSRQNSTIHVTINTN